MDKLILGSFNRRIFAALIDLFIILFSISYLTLLILTFDLNSDYFVNMIKLNELFLNNSNLPQIISGSLYILITSICWATIQATPGQYLMKLKVVNKEGEKISFLNSLIRSVFYLVSLFSIILHIISVFLILIRKDKKSIHDLLAKTIIIKKE